MKQCLESVALLYGDTANVRLPNELFSILAKTVARSGKPNIKQESFAYSYLIVIGLLYKYASYIDVANSTYVQNSDIKEMLGYSKTTKSVDKIIKKDGLLDQEGLTKTTANYPVEFYFGKDSIGNLDLREFVMIQDIEEEEKAVYKSIAKNRNYEVKTPAYLFDSIGDREFGTLYSGEKTHTWEVREFLTLLSDPDLELIDILLYGYFKSRCKGYRYNKCAIPLKTILTDLMMDSNTYYRHLGILKDKGYLFVNHTGWKMGGEPAESNSYRWKGV